MLRGLLSLKSLVIAACVLALAAGLVVVSVWLDHRTDRRRPMYYSVIQMEDLQWDLLNAGKPPVYVRLHPKSKPVKIKDPAFSSGFVWFAPKKNVTVIVEERDGKTCVQGNNQYDDRTAWLCVDPDLPRPKLGGLE